MPGQHPAHVRFHPSDTRAEAVARMAGAFRAAGLPTPDVDARHLLCGLLNISKAGLIAEPDATIGDLASRVADGAARRLLREPVSRILGCKEFYGRTFRITPDVLDPRPETETVIDLVLDILDSAGGRNAALRIADIGTGSGAILVTLLAELSGATGVGTDISRAALEVAEENALALGVAGRAAFLHTRGLAGIEGAFDIVVSNPPYIATSDIAGLDADVAGFDPMPALDGGADGLAIYREIANEIIGLNRTTWTVLELGIGQLEMVTDIFTNAAAGPGRLERLTRNDLGGHVRAVAFRHHR